MKKQSADSVLLSFRVSKADKETILRLVKQTKSRVRADHNPDDYLISSAEIVTYVLKKELPKLGKKDAKKIRE